MSAQALPVVGVWEQLSVAGKPGDQARQRKDFIFTNQKLDADTVFGGLVDVGSRAAVLCGVKASKDADLSLAQLLKKYPWEDDDVDHLKKIIGAKYIYDAQLIEDAQQNARMRELMKDLNMPPPLSPYSAPVIAGKIAAVDVDKRFAFGSASVDFTTQSLRGGEAIAYKFSINGTRVTLTEQNYPD